MAITQDANFSAQIEGQGKRVLAGTDRDGDVSSVGENDGCSRPISRHI